ncbi:ribosome maturation factor RimM [Caldimonas sp. KR1-144]|uniref:ribosome maturation factor RimM n=1 Tax=Caldimonas sp. KR1-144 TaxID=3400911 RepID=UPI003BFFE17F
MRDADVLNPAGESTAWPDDAIEVGRIIDAWGVKGGFKVLPFSNEPDALLASRRWYLKADEARVRPAGAAPLPPALSIRSARDQGDVIVATSPEIADRNAAESLKGARVFVSRTAFPAAGEGEYYWIDLIGLSVVNRAGEALGTVEGLLDTGAHSVLRVSFDAGGEKLGERLIPFVDAYVDQVDLPGRRIVVDWGLDY